MDQALWLPFKAYVANCCGGAGLLVIPSAGKVRIHSSVVLSQRSVVLDIRGTFVKPRPRAVSDIMNARYNLFVIMNSFFP